MRFPRLTPAHFASPGLAAQALIWAVKTSDTPGTLCAMPKPVLLWTKIMNTLTQKKCIYCNKRKDRTEFSKEHIIPETLIKNLLIDLNITHDVCKKCNNNLGLHVDSRFARSWIYKFYCALGSYEYLRIDKTNDAPLIYWGKIDNLNIGNEYICELWGSPCGSRILHIHNKSSFEFDDLAGGDPKQLRKRPGIAIFINMQKSQDKLLLGLRAFVRHFKKAKRYINNITFRDEENYSIVGDKPNTYIQNIVDDFFIKYPIKEDGQLISQKFFVNIDFENRLLAKIGIGLAYNILGPSFLETDSYKDLYNTLWNKSSDNNLFILNFFKSFEIAPLDQFSWKGGIVISFHSTNNKIILCLSIYNNIIGIELVNNFDGDIYKKFTKYLNTVYIVIPIIKYCVEISYYDFLLYKTGNKSSRLLVQLDEMRTNFRPY
ncbi:HNH endonuclease [Brucepastera parasyntrophica]|uniref:HNH endonuclease n=1 Tax=Brucepastera parasyntrophica TaxID=2880008 RepID=UPI00210B59B6|nr:HNH endonuclease [Brucepastera parasyntrophica]ULQ61029.1 HNH endonuclease [Brucepastera parasyntrophica]